METEDTGGFNESFSRSDFLRLSSFMNSGGLFPQQDENSQLNETQQSIGINLDSNLGLNSGMDSFGIFQDKSDPFRMLRSYQNSISTLNEEQQQQLYLLQKQIQQQQQQQKQKQQQQQQQQYEEEQDQKFKIPEKPNQIIQKNQREKIKKVVKENDEMKQQIEELVNILHELKEQIETEIQIREEREEEIEKYQDLFRQLILKGVSLNPEDY
ncbi:hypothetical protein M0813_10778 [Anaeramoeba flamelloides]|uniref:Uncharacterized protein n=1 Tax=Anaeramoeba flamelloides TaxID=1746091 RepID=A0ABQ8X2C0_9EUKA|nr:hypothetical protein M0813_10778 [Anaeramoeba flamelloides]